MIKVKTINAESFKKYGVVIEQKAKGKVFDVLTGDKNAKGWRLGYLVTGPDRVKVLEKHPSSMETFEPVSGTAIMILAEEKTPDKMEAFLLDKPVCLYKSIWHAVSVISDKAEIKITENFEVESLFHKLKKSIDIAYV